MPPIPHVSRQRILAVVGLRDLAIGDDLTVRTNRSIFVVEKSLPTLCRTLGVVIGDQPFDVVGYCSAIRLAIFLRIKKCAKLDQMSNRVDVNCMTAAAEP